MNLDEELINSNDRQNTLRIVGNNSQLNNDESPVVFTSGLYNQLLGKDRQKSKFYNILLLAMFNMNIAQYTFPYLTKSLGIIVMLIVCLISIIFSYLLTNSILKFLTNNKLECNLSKIVESNFGTYATWIVEIFSLVSFFTLLFVSLSSLQNSIINIFDLSFYFENENTILIIISAILGILYISLNMIEKPIIIDFYVFICILCQLIQVIVSI